METVNILFFSTLCLPIVLARIDDDSSVIVVKSAHLSIGSSKSLFFFLLYFEMVTVFGLGTTLYRLHYFYFFVFELRLIKISFLCSNLQVIYLIIFIFSGKYC